MKKTSRDLILGKVVYINSNHQSYPRFLTLFIEWLRFFSFDHMKGENREYLQVAVPLLAEFLPRTFPLKLHQHLQQFLENVN